MILKTFLTKNMVKFTVFMPKANHNIGFQENLQYFCENWSESAKIVMDGFSPSRSGFADLLVLRIYWFSGPFWGFFFLCAMHLPVLRTALKS
jgi:hypothetical protein